ncbi:MAG: ERF family protein [Hyphomicrobiales bacterium]|nr:ERF family protein [Hyphomicrobiales bacterium]
MNEVATVEGSAVEVVETDPAPVAPSLQPETAAILQVIERAASNPAVDIDKMERLLEMQERIMERSAKAAFFAALADMQPELPVIDRRGRIEIRDKNNQENIIQSTPYALWEDINEAISPVLAEYGFALSFRIGQTPEGKIAVTGVLSHRDGHHEETTLPLMHDSTGSKNAVQAVGSSVSYGKRYTAFALLNLTSRGEDDDGRSAGAPAIISDEQNKLLRELMDEVSADIPGFCRYFQINSVAELPASEYDRAVAALNKKRGKKQ